MDSVKKVPEIRFKGFDDEWRKAILGNVANIYDGIHQTPKYKEHGVMFLSVEDIKTLKSDKFISKEDFLRDFNVYPEHGDVLMTRIGDIGTSNVISTDEELAYYVSLALIKPFDIASYYLNYLISSNLFREELNNRTLGTAIPKKINMGEIGKINFYKPLEKEQTQIGNFFKNIDEKLELEKEKHQKLVNFKKAMLDDMFPKEGENVPEVRFEGFDDEWERDQLRDLAYIKKGEQLDSNCITDGGKYYHLNGGITPSNRTDLYNTEANTISISEGGNSCGYVNWNSERFYSGGHNYTLNVYDLNAMFLYQNLKSKQDNIMSLRVGSGLPNIQKNLLNDLEISYCSLEEQILIGNFFKNLDEKIEISEKKIEKIENFKKAMLDKMFV